MEDIIIVGAGLSGLSAAYYLKKQGVEALVLEARERCGGRIFTAHAKGNNTAVEMGATWFTDNHSYLKQLLKELKLSHFKQYQQGISVFDLYPNPPQFFDMAVHGEASYRVAGGTSALIGALADSLGRERIILNTPVAEVTEKDGQVEVSTSEGKKYTSKTLIITLPPNLVQAQKVKFKPELPDEVTLIMAGTHTWMGSAIKFALEYSSPFWRSQGFSGTVISQSAIASEVYDHSNHEDNHFALKGFLSPDAGKLSKEEREAGVVKQLARLLGREAESYLSYTEKIWEHDPYTFAPYKKQVMPHQHNGHPVYKNPLMNGKLYLAGTETSSYYGGYMEGAVYSGLTTAKQILHR